MKVHFLFITGPSGAGKDYAAHEAHLYLKKQGFKVIQLALADHLKDLASDLLTKVDCNFTKQDLYSRSKKESYRPLLNMIGTYAKPTTYFVDELWKKITRDLYNSRDIKDLENIVFIVTDLRFRKELYSMLAKIKSLNKIGFNIVLEIKPKFNLKRFLFPNPADAEVRYISEEALKNGFKVYKLKNNFDSEFKRGVIKIVNSQINSKEL